MDLEVMHKLIELGRLEAEKAELERLLKCAHERIDELLEREYDRTRDNIIAVYENTSGYKEAAALREEVEGLGKQNQRFRRDHTHLSEMNSAMQRAIAEKNTQISELSHRLDQLHRENHDMRATLSVSDGMVSAQSNMIEKMNADIAQLVQEAEGDAKSVRIPVTPVDGAGAATPSNGHSDGNGAAE